MFTENTPAPDPNTGEKLMVEPERSLANPTNPNPLPENIQPAFVEDPSPNPGGPDPAPGGPNPLPESIQPASAEDPSPNPGGPDPAPGGPDPAAGGSSAGTNYISGSDNPGGPSPLPAGPNPLPTANPINTSRKIADDPSPNPGGPDPAPGGPNPAF